MSERRRRAARRHPVVILLLTGPLLGILFGSSLLGKTHGLLLVLLLACSVAPASIWWARQMPSLRTLGYGRLHP